MYQLNRHNPEREQKLLEKACTLLHATTGLRVDVELLDNAPEGADAFGYLINDVAKTRVFIEVRTHPTKAVVGAIAQQFKQYPEKGLLVADYINPVMAERLKELYI